jgi:hydrogenase 3 maturation protease
MVTMQGERSVVDASAAMLQEELRGWRQIAILGLGNEFGGDDGLGLLAAQELEQNLTCTPRVNILTAGTAPENYTGLLRKLSPSHILIIDAAEMGERAGMIKRIDPAKIASQEPSTHSISLDMLAGYLERELNSKVIILGIQPKRICFGASMSDEVKTSIKQLIHLIKQSICNLSEDKL